MSRPEKTFAEKIAKIVESEMKTSDVASLFASIERINHRLDKLESSATHPTKSEHAILTHPSVEKFSVAEAIADEIFSGVRKEKACTFEPNGKPCDHCAMCSSRGF
jgi:hypothetical protein